jgi:membrane protease YdiL (CAAX protease family)
VRWSLIALACAFVATGLGFGGWRVYELESSELDVRFRWLPLEPTPEIVEGRGEQLLPHREIGRAWLDRGKTVSFQVCARDQLRPEQWADAGLVIAVWIPAAQRVVARVALDRETLAEATRGREGACLVVAQGSDLVEGGEYAIEAVWPGDGSSSPGPPRVLFQGRVIAHDPPRASDRWAVSIVLLGAILLTLAFAGARAPVEVAAQTARDDGSLAWTLAQAIAAVAALVAAGVALGYVPLGDALWTLVNSLTLAGIELALIAAFVRPWRHEHKRERETIRSTVGLVRPRQGVWALALAPVVGVALYFIGQVALRVVPATGVSSVGVIVGWPSGSLAVGLAGVLSPLVEEVFFRGFIYGTLDRRLGRLWAFVVTVVLFAGAHLSQSWGAWGGLTAIAITGAGLTALRLWTGSALAPALAHLAHNGVIALFGAMAGVGALVGK